MKQTIIFLTLLLFISSCATIFSGSNQNINFVPSNGRDDMYVEIRQDDKIFSSQVPGFVSVGRDNDNLIVTIKEDECYKSSQTIIPYKTNPFIFANFLGGIYGLTSTTTDRVSGAAWKYDETVYISPRKKTSCKN